MRVKKINGQRAGVEILDVDLSKADPQEILQIGQLVIENLIVVIRGQQLTPQREVEVCKTIGSVESVTAFNRCPTDESGQPVAEIQRVTGMLHPDGTPMGLFGHDHDLDWHANRPSAELERKPIIWLYSVFGTRGTRTSWANCAAAYDDLDSATKAEIENLYGIYGFEPNRYTSWNEWKSHRNEQGIRFVHTIKETGRKGMYFPYLQLFGFKGKEDDYSQKLIERLRQHLMQDQYIYHHDWADGDVVLSEQWLTIHKRWACDVSNRMLHRISLGYENVIFNSRTESQPTGVLA